jgi:hypothetical protein
LTKYDKDGIKNKLLLSTGGEPVNLNIVSDPFIDLAAACVVGLIGYIASGPFIRGRRGANWAVRKAAQANPGAILHWQGPWRYRTLIATWHTAIGMGLTGGAPVQVRLVASVVSSAPWAVNLEVYDGEQSAQVGLYKWFPVQSDIPPVAHCGTRQDMREMLSANVRFLLRGTVRREFASVLALAIAARNGYAGYDIADVDRT